MMRRLLWPLTPLYAAAVAAKNAAYDRNWFKAQRLAWPVVSVGNISVGGSGKTPLVIALAELLAQHGLRVNVLSRGYGRSSNAVEKVDSAGSSERFGDEPLLIAQAADVPVFVGASRYAAGLLAEKEQPGPCIHLLDDGFQHRKLARNVDIVVVHRSDFEEAVLPAGRLREPLSALQRASILVIRKEDADLEARFRQQGINTPIWWIERSAQIRQNAGRTLVFCGIARPEEFFLSLKASGIDTVATRAFHDHHRYGKADILQLIGAANASSAETFLTTDKDFVRLSQEQRDALSAVVPLKTVKLTVRFLDETAVLQQLLALLPAIPNRSV
jgi:tetraacyldisaccharide 4'-kinase